MRIHLREWLSGRASPCQGECRGFESRFPLQRNVCTVFLWRYSQEVRQGSAKPSLPGSNPGGASKQKKALAFYASAFFSEIFPLGKRNGFALNDLLRKCERFAGTKDSINDTINPSSVLPKIAIQMSYIKSMQTPFDYGTDQRNC